MAKRRLTNAEQVEYAQLVTFVVGLIIMVSGLIWQLWYVAVKGSIPIGRAMKGTTFGSDPLSFSLYVVSLTLLLTFLVLFAAAKLRARRRDKIKSKEAANLHIAQIYEAAKDQIVS